MDRRVTQRVPVAELDRLLADPPRAALAFASDRGPASVPVAVRRDGEALLVGLLDESILAVAATGPVAVVVDDGRYWFELRAVMARGRLGRPEPAAPGEPVWVPLIPEHVVAWDYDRLRAEGEP